MTIIILLCIIVISLAMIIVLLSCLLSKKGAKLNKESKGYIEEAQEILNKLEKMRGMNG